jgi:hypothetical protein
MTTGQAAITLSWLVRDTFRQSLSNGLFWVLLAASGLCVLVCASIGVQGDRPLDSAVSERADFLPRAERAAHDPALLERDGVAVVSGDLTLAFGAVSVPLDREARGAVRFVQLVLAGGVADTLGLLLALVWTAGFLPAFLDPRSVTVLLARPAPRWLLLLGKYVGVLAFVLVQAVIFVIGTWLALGWRTGIWEAAYLWTVPLLLLHFAIFFGFSLLLAVCTRSTVVCVIGTIGFWLLCWGLNYGRHAALAAEQVAPEGAFASQLVWLVDASYWIFPKPADMGLLLFDALGAGEHFQRLFDDATLEQAGGVSLALSVATSLAFTAYLLVASAREFQTADY